MLKPYTNIAAIFLLAACGPNGASTPDTGKIEGPDIKTLTPNQVMSTLQQCTRYGRIDDPKVKYTVQYCSEIQSAHLSEGYAVPGNRKVEPTITPLH